MREALDKMRRARTAKAVGKHIAYLLDRESQATDMMALQALCTYIREQGRVVPRLSDGDMQ